LEALVHVAFGLIALSFAVRNILWLRALSMLASVTMIVYALEVLDPARPIVLWNLAFIAINGTQIAITVLGEQRVRFSNDERQLHERVFPALSRLDFRTLVRLGEWREGRPGERLVAQGEAQAELMLIARGGARVELDARPIATLGPGQFVAEMSFVSGQPASATVTLVGEARYLAWSSAALATLSQRRPTIGRALEAVIGSDLSHKLRLVSAHRPSVDRAAQGRAPPEGAQSQ
jgi:CRP-like cAMP-binding protein